MTRDRDINAHTQGSRAPATVCSTPVHIPRLQVKDIARCSACHQHVAACKHADSILCHCYSLVSLVRRKMHQAIRRTASASSPAAELMQQVAADCLRIDVLRCELLCGMLYMQVICTHGSTAPLQLLYGRCSLTTMRPANSGQLDALVHARCLPVVCSTPLGCPVLPEVYSVNRGCSASTHSTAHSGDCACSCSCHHTSRPSCQPHSGTSGFMYTSTLATCNGHACQRGMDAIICRYGH